MSVAIVISQPGGPDVLKAIEITLSEPGPDDVQIQHEVIGVNFVDIYFRSGLYPLPSSPAVPGFEGGGRVIAVGENVRAFTRGDRVAYTGNPMGAYTELRNIPASRLIKIPEGITIRTAGSTMLRGLTAHMLLHKVRNVKAGDWLLVHSAAGGLGQIVTRWATLKGARVIGTTGSVAKIKIAQAAGAAEVLLHTDPAWAESVREIADGRGVHRWHWRRHARCNARRGSPFWHGGKSGAGRRPCTTGACRRTWLCPLYCSDAAKFNGLC